MRVMGIDPGLSGALAIYDTESRALTIHDTPTWLQRVGGKERARIDPSVLIDIVEFERLQGLDAAFIEQVSGRTGQSASAAFEFGVVYGRTIQTLVAQRLKHEAVTPQVWKKELKVPGKGNDTAKEVAGTLARRAEELFGPERASLWRGTRGGILVDRVEAALIAYYGCIVLSKRPD